MLEKNRDLRLAIKIILSAYLWNNVVLLQAQDKEAWNEVKSLFENPENGIWVQYYLGKDSRSVPFKLVLAYDNHEYKGILYHIDGSIQTYFEGDYSPENIQFVCLDNKQNRIGSFKGIRKDSTLNGEYFNNDKTEATIYTFKRTLSGQENVQCSGLEYFKRFESADQIELFVQHHEDHSVEADFVSHTGNILSYKGNCPQSNCSKPLLRLTSFIQGEHKILSCSGFDSNRIDINERLPMDNCGKKTTFIQQGQLHLRCQYFTKDKYHVATKLPDVSHRSFDKWLDELILAWINQVLSYNALEERQLYSSNEVDLDFYNQDFISGILWFKEPWSATPRPYHFNYDLRSNKLLDLDDFFVREKEVMDSIFKLRDEWKENLTKDLSMEERDFFEKDKFDIWTIKSQGICFHSRFSPVYGVRKFIVPFDQLDTYLKKSGSIKKIIAR